MAKSNAKKTKASRTGTKQSSKARKSGGSDPAVVSPNSATVRAIWSAGVALNTFYFHAVQASLMLERSEVSFAEQALKTLQSALYKCSLHNTYTDDIEHQICELRESIPAIGALWSSESLHGLNNDILREELSYEGGGEPRNAVIDSYNVGLTDLMDRTEAWILIRLPHEQHELLRLGNVFDEGRRPKNVAHFMLEHEYAAPNCIGLLQAERAGGDSTSCPTTEIQDHPASSSTPTSSEASDELPNSANNAGKSPVAEVSHCAGSGSLDSDLEESVALSPQQATAIDSNHVPIAQAGCRNRMPQSFLNDDLIQACGEPLPWRVANHVVASGEIAPNEDWRLAVVGRAGLVLERSFDLASFNRLIVGKTKQRLKAIDVLEEELLREIENRKSAPSTEGRRDGTREHQAVTAPIFNEVEELLDVNGISFRVRKNELQLVRAFHAADWEQPIPNPFTGHKAKERAENTSRDANKRMVERNVPLRFSWRYGEEGDQQFWWRYEVESET